MILVTGGAGVIGSRLVRGLVEAGNKVRVLTLPNDPLVNRLDGLDVDIRYGDVSDRASIETICEGVKTVYHLAAVLLSRDPVVFAARERRTGRRTWSSSRRRPASSTSCSCSSISVTYPYTTPYSLSKRECERIVQRPGHDALHDRAPHPRLQRVRRRGVHDVPGLPEALPGGALHRPRKALKNPVHVDDLMRGFLAIPNNPKAYGKTYAFSGSEEIVDLGPRQGHAPPPGHLEALRAGPGLDLQDHRRRDGRDHAEAAAHLERHRRPHPGREPRLVRRPART